MNIIEAVSDALSNEVNLIFVVIIFTLAIIDIKKKKDLKSQIVSIGVLGTFFGIFMGLQDFNPEDMKNSINNILVGLKTAFFTSIVGMGTAILLAIYQRLWNKDIDNEKNEERILIEISEKLNKLDKLDSSQDTDKIIGELERIRTVQTDTRKATEKISVSINELRDNSNKENQELINILNTNFDKMNNSLEIAIEKLSKGATEEIIKALEKVIQDFNQELQTQFAGNFGKLSDAVTDLIEWQNNYKTHIETLEERLQLSTESIEKSKESLEIISSKNEEILNVYQELKHIINIYDRQINDLNQHLETYATLSNSAESMFSTISTSIGHTKEEFTSLANVIANSNTEQKTSFIKTTDDIKKEYKNLTEHIKNEHIKQKESSKQITESIANDIKIKTNEIKTNFDNLTNSFEQNSKELDLVSNHFKSLGQQIPEALKISLEALNIGLTSLTTQFQKDYKKIMDEYKGNN